MHVLVELTGAKKRLDRARRHVEQYSVVNAFIDGQARVYYTVAFIASRSSPWIIQRTRGAVRCVYSPLEVSLPLGVLRGSVLSVGCGPSEMGGWVVAFHFFLSLLDVGFTFIRRTSHLVSIYPRINTRCASRNRRKHGVQLLDPVFSPILLFSPTGHC